MDRRIRYCKDKEEILNTLVRSEGASVFTTFADALTFAAAYGYSKNLRIPLTADTAEPIRSEVFERRGYDTLMYLLGVAALGSLEVLSDRDEWVERRVSVFEEYANGGLALLADELKGVQDVVGKLLLLLGEYRPGSEKATDFDLSRFIPRAASR